MIKQHLVNVSESKLFYGILAFNLLLLFTLKFYPTCDGPAHLYNANILCNLIKGTDSIEAFYSINRIPIPNWTAHFILVVFRFIMPAWLAEKLLLSLYIVGMAVSFQFLIKQLTRGSIALSILIFPFIYTFLFHLGFYNYSFSFIILFLTLGYWIKTRGQRGLVKYLLLGLLITSSYFSNVLGFIFTCLCLCLLMISYLTSDYKNKPGLTKALLSESLSIFILTIPSLVCFVLFYKQTAFFSSTSAVSNGELIKWLNDVRPLIVYNYSGEEKLTEQFLHIIVAVVAISLTFRVKDGKCFKRSDVLLIAVLASLVALFFVPDGASAGMMSSRFCLMAYILLIIWVAAQPVPTKVRYVATFFIVIFHLALLLTHKNGTLNGLNKDATEINHASSFIEEGSVILPVNMSNNWLEAHFSNYIGIDKPVVILENYEASVGWFPVVWNSESMPQIKIANQPAINGLTWINSSSSKSIKEIDYVLLYGNTEAIADSSWSELEKVLQTNYQRIYTSTHKYVALFKHNK